MLSRRKRAIRKFASVAEASSPAAVGEYNNTICTVLDCWEAAFVETN
jgi:hypothetical protein